MEKMVLITLLHPIEKLFLQLESFSVSLNRFQGMDQRLDPVLGDKLAEFAYPSTSLAA
jgi:hypothetical protein